MIKKQIYHLYEFSIRRKILQMIWINWNNSNHSHFKTKQKNSFMFVYNQIFCKTAFLNNFVKCFSFSFKRKRKICKAKRK